MEALSLRADCWTIGPLLWQWLAFRVGISVEFNASCIGFGIKFGVDTGIGVIA